MYRKTHLRLAAPLALAMSFSLANTTWALGYPQDLIFVATGAETTPAKHAPGKRSRPQYATLVQQGDSITQLINCPRPVKLSAL